MTGRSWSVRVSVRRVLSLTAMCWNCGHILVPPPDEPRRDRDGRGLPCLWLIALLIHPNFCDRFSTKAVDRARQISVGFWKACYMRATPIQRPCHVNSAYGGSSEFKIWSGARDLNPGPHGPEPCVSRVLQCPAVSCSVL